MHVVLVRVHMSPSTSTSARSRVFGSARSRVAPTEIPKVATGGGGFSPKAGFWGPGTNGAQCKQAIVLSF